MRLIAIEREADIGALAERLYPELTPDTRKQAEAALLKANPGLQRSGTLRPGLLVSVPDLSELGVKPATHGKDPAADLLNVLKAAIGGYRAVLASRHDAAQADVEQQQRLLHEREIAAAIGADRNAAELARTLAANLEARSKAIDDEKHRADAALARIAHDLDRLR